MIQTLRMAEFVSPKYTFQTRRKTDDYHRVSWNRSTTDHVWYQGPAPVNLIDHFHVSRQSNNSVELCATINAAVTGGERSNRSVARESDPAGYIIRAVVGP